MKSPGQNKFSNRRRNSRIVSPTIVFVAVVSLIILVMQFFFPRIFTLTFSYIFSPIWSDGNSAVSLMTPRSELVKENQDLKQQLALYNAEASSSKAVFLENDELKAMLGRSAKIQNLVLAYVIRRPPGAGYDYMIIDVGKSENVSVGNLVYSDGSVSIGQVREADLHTAKVELYSSPGTEYDALIGANHIPVEAVGQGGGFFSASLSREAGVVNGDEVIIPAISSTPLGYVRAVISDPVQPFEKILFYNGINPYQLEMVLVETNSTSTKPFTGNLLASTSPATSKK